MASFCLHLAAFVTLLFMAETTRAQFSTISAAPSALPSTATAPSPSTSAPSLSPDINPLFPTPGCNAMPPSPTEASMPTIPSTPSPPNPDDLLSPGPGMSFPPAEAMLPASSSDTTGPAAFLGMLLFCLMHV